MKKKFFEFRWSELLFPIYNDIRNINFETTNTVTTNSWELVDDCKQESNEKIFSEIEKIRESNANHSKAFIIVDELKDK
jgi:hypothetical protein